ncbi:GDSL esterase/lipase At1g29670-like isoform X2 [Alnus glutinosa]|uniref:GDSL esterase/lipase At1g29670-like isoform X2 n=1 Tax=Alnus glutinosa TaxID=3517 RepID=UPI002D7995A8|nr:GDSL esterase/lipase At1g29670-like isoform X2 [Alnus glutinosa]
MASKKLMMTILWIVFVFLQSCANGKPQVPCLFVFGDSLSDDGNNNNLVTLAKCNYRPYGIDFPKGPTGRFSNGPQLLGFEDYIPPFATARGKEILKGVNYASGAAGIRNETSGQNQGDRISMDRQLKNHETTMSEINRMLGNNHNTTVEYLSKCIYSVAIGSNDYLSNYFLPQYYPTSRLYTQQQYAVVLIDQLSQQLTTLYQYGARKLAVFGLSEIGSIPLERSLCGNGTKGSACVDNINNAAQLFNDRLKSLLSQLNNKLTNATFIFINATEIGATSPSLASMVADVPCCKVSNITGLCKPFGNTCSNRSQYIYWDAIHPTEAMDALFAGRAYKAQSPNDASPFDISHLAQL